MAPKDVGSDKPRLDKLGVKPGTRVFLDGVFDAPFHAELDARGVDIVTRLQQAEVAFLAVESLEELSELGVLRGGLADDAALWCVWPKGRAALKEDHIRAAALAEGLVDVKVIRFSESHSALKLVIPLAARAPKGPAKRASSVPPRRAPAKPSARKKQARKPSAHPKS